MLKVLVLGSGSFIGRHLTDVLSKKSGIELTIFGRNPHSGFNRNVRFIKGDFQDSVALQKALKEQDVVYHFISQTIPSSTWNSPLTEIEKNLTPSLKLIELCAESGVRKICFASSGGTVYGLQQNLLTEESRTEPFSPHGIVKRTIESFLMYAELKHQISYDVYRISNVYGEGQNVGKGLGFINTSLENIVNERPVTVYGDGENVRDYIYVRDVANLLTLATFKNLEDSDIYNVSSNQAISLNELIGLLKDVTKRDFEIRYFPDRASDNKRVILDNSKIMKCFNDYPLTSLIDGVKNTYDYLMNKRMSVENGV